LTIGNDLHESSAIQIEADGTATVNEGLRTSMVILLVSGCNQSPEMGRLEGTARDSLVKGVLDDESLRWPG
jgi:hypothetical protein